MKAIDTAGSLARPVFRYLRGVHCERGHRGRHTQTQINENPAPTLLCSCPASRASLLIGLPYHITQRGNGRQHVFFDGADYHLYVDLLRSNAANARLVVWAYCLMPNHVHL
jgi:hypothetical protein